MQVRTGVSFLSITAALLAALLCLEAAAQGAPRPRVGLVLGGGGARGAAHIGVLEVLERLRVPVDCVAGTSMGALVSGGFVGGLTSAQMSAELASANWRDMFQDEPEFWERSFHSKALQLRFLPGSEIGVGDHGVQALPGVLGGQKIKLFFNHLVRSDMGERDIESLPLPLSLIATDIASGERVVLRDGSLTSAMRASMSVPGLMAPLEYRGRKLVDGGLVDNVPIREVRERCRAEVVIAVNVGSPLLKPEAIGSLLSVAAQMINILTEQNVTQSLATLGPRDIYIKPDLEGITAGDFERHAETADRGRKAAEAVTDRLRALSVSEAEYAAWWGKVEYAKRDAPRIDEVQIAGLKRANPASVERHLGGIEGERLDTAKLEHGIGRVYGDGYYEGVDYKVLTQRDRNILRVAPLEKGWGPNYLRFGISLDNNIGDYTSYGLRGAYQMTWLNRLGAEVIVGAEIGNNPEVVAQFYQPLDGAQRFFVEPSVRYGRRQANLYQNNQRIAEYKVDEARLTLAAGTNIGILGQARVGWLQRSEDATLSTGTLLLPATSKNYGGWIAGLEFDRMDRLYFPTHGWSSTLAYFDSSKEHYSRLNAEVRGVTSFKDTVLNGRVSFVGSPRGTLPAFDAGAIGGFGNLSGFARRQIIADQVTYAGVRVEQIIGRLPLGLRGDIRVGLALEGAQVKGNYTEAQFGSNLNSIALYLGGETPIGPVYLGWGYASKGTGSVQIFIGTP